MSRYMIEALSLAAKHGRKYLRCDQTGEVALMTEWAQRIAELRGVSKASVYAHLSSAMRRHVPAYGSTWYKLKASEVRDGLR